MSAFTASKKTASDFNNGVKYINGEGNITGDAVSAETINNLVEGVLYTQETLNYTYRETATLRSSNWINNIQTVLLDKGNAYSRITIYPADGSAAAYVLANITVAQSDGLLRFTYTTKPTSDIELIIDYFNLGEY